MTVFMSVLSGVHCRFLSLAVTLPPAREAHAPKSVRGCAPCSRRRSAERLAAGGTSRSGLLLGHRVGDCLQVQAILCAGYGWQAPEALSADAQYPLGALDATQRCSDHPLITVGHFPERLVIRAWVADDQSRTLKVVSTITGGGS